jgi:hypothetical protein
MTAAPDEASAVVTHSGQQEHTSARAEGPRARLRRPRGGSRARQNRHGLQWTGSLEKSGLKQSGPRPVVDSGRLIMARGPA